MADEAKKYLDYDGLKHLVEKLTDRIEASGGGTDSHAVELLKSVVTFPADPSYGIDGARTDPSTDDIPLTDVLKLTDDMYYSDFECDDPRFSVIAIGSLKSGYNNYISCGTANTAGSDIHATLRLTVVFSDGEQRTVNVIAVQSAAQGAVQGVYVAYVDADKVNRICRPSEWSADMGTPSGAVIVAGGRNLLVGPGYLDEMDSHCADDIPTTGVTACFEDELQARNDFRGRENTQEREENGGFENAVSFCLSYSYGAVGAGRWWMPSLGEVALVYDFLDGVVEAFNAIGTNWICASKSIASNTIQRKAESAWELRFWEGGEACTYRRDESSDYDAFVFPVSDWVWVGD